MRAAAMFGLTATLIATASAAVAGAAPTTLVGGVGGDDTFLNGEFAPARFHPDPAGYLVVDGHLTGTVTGPPGTTQKTVDQPVTLPIDRGASTGTCWMIDLAMGPADQTLAGFPIHLDRTNLHIEAKQGLGSRLRVPMCAFAEALPDDAADSAQLSGILNHILELRAVGPAPASP